MLRKMHPVLKRVIVTGAALLVIAGILLLLFSLSGQTGSFTNDGIVCTDVQPIGEPIENLYTVEADGTKMTYDPESMLLTLILPTGESVRSYPQTTPDDGMTVLGARALRAPFEYTYVTEDYTVKTESPISNADLRVKTFEIPNGFVLQVRENNIRVGFSIEVTLEKGDIVVKVPFNGIRDSEQAKLLSISPFPLFGAARQGDEGYAVLPDGIGGVTYFKNRHDIYEGNGYEKEIYSDDLTVVGFDEAYEEKVRLPVFGMVTQTGTLTGIMTQGESDSKLIMSPPGVMGISFYRTRFEMVYRKSYLAQITKGEYATRYFEDMIPGDREMRYHYEAGNTGYVGVAQAYAQYLLDSGVKETDQAMDRQWIKFFMAVKKGTDSISDKMIVMTDTDDLLEIGDDILKNAGKSDFEIAGYYKNGYASWVGGKYPVNSKIGGEDGLKAVIQHFQQQGVRLSLEENFFTDYRSGLSINKRKQSAKTPESVIYNLTEIQPNGEAESSDRITVMNPVFALNNMEKDLNKASKLSPNSLKLTGIGTSAFTDYNQEHSLYKQQAIQTYLSQLKKVKDCGLQADVESGNAYVLGEASRITDVTIQTSDSYMIDESVPFYSLVASRFAPIYSTPVNLMDDSDTAALRCLEYGVLPKYELTKQSAELLADTDYSELYSSDYATHKSLVIQTGKLLEQIGNLRLVSHRKLADDVYESVYDSGKKAVYNYSDAVYSLNGMQIAPNSCQIY